MPKIRLLILITFIFQNLSLAQFSGLPKIDVFSPEEYSAGMQNWWMVQDSLGNIFSANNHGILRYNGVDWQKLNISEFNNKKARSLDVSGLGVIYVGGENEIGFLYPDRIGTIKYNSLNVKLDSSYRQFEDVWRVHCSDKQVFFSTHKEIFLYENDTVIAIRSNSKLSFSFMVNQTLVVADEEKGLIALNNGEWVDIPGGGFFSNKEISSIVSYEDKWLIGDVDNGLFLLDSAGRVEKWKTQIDLIEDHTTDQILILNNGDVSISTKNNGLIILDGNGKLKFHLSTDSGLPDRSVLNAYEDYQGNLWLGLNLGIAKINFSTPYTYFNGERGVHGAGYGTLVRGSNMFLCTRNGLFVVNEEEFSVKWVEGAKGHVYNINDIDGDLLMASHEGAFQVIDEKAYIISEIKGWWQFLKIPNSNKIIAGTYNGLYVLEKEGTTYKVINKINGFEESSLLMVFEDQHSLWVSHAYKGAYRIKLSENFERAEQVAHYGQNNGFPSNFGINVFDLNGEIVFTAEEGMYKFDKTLEKIVEHEILQNAIGEEVKVYDLDMDNQGNIYFMGDKYFGALRPDFNGSYQVDTLKVHDIYGMLNDDFANISAINTRSILFGGKDGFIQFDPHIQRFASKEIRVNFESLSFTHGLDSIIADAMLFAIKRYKVFEIPENINSFKISYASPYFSGKVQYSYMFEGRDQGWSMWSDQSNKGYSNLPHGDYVFKVRAKNEFGSISSEKRLLLKVLPVWYKTIWFRWFMGILTTGILLTLFRAQSLKHRSEKHNIIQLKDHEVNAISQKSKIEIEQIKEEKTKAELIHKTRELASNTMNLVNKTELLFQIKSDLKVLKSLRKSEDFSKRLSKIIRTIDQNIANENDWDQFQFYFDEVHGDFSKRFKEAFSDITPQELRLCVYLRLNMNTKEIANLLNISPRSVETSRYRVRKKLSLTHDSNLTEFILNF